MKIYDGDDLTLRHEMEEEEAKLINEDADLQNQNDFKAKEVPEVTLGWPLLRIPLNVSICDEDDESGVEQQPSSSSSRRFSHVSLHPVSDWPLLSVKPPFDSTRNVSSEGEDNNYVKEEKFTENDPGGTCLVTPEKLSVTKELVGVLKISGFRQFTYVELSKATSHFSTECFIGEGGCSEVYKGHLKCGKTIAVKVLKQYHDAWRDFLSEVDIVSSIKHKHIASLIGVCIGHTNPILVYDFFSQGTLQESLEESVIPWKVRFKVAIAVAEALHYLQNECSPPIIHRDVKSSNILLSDEFQPQLSDFGLAIRRPPNSTYTTQSDIVGTFGYIAPECFMHGRVSDKTDVYSFGVLLLELLTGKKPILYNGSKGQQSLVNWARPILESGNGEALLDPILNKKCNIVEMRRMLVAATLCTKQSVRLRPNMNQILKLLKGQEKESEFWKSHVDNLLVSIDDHIEDSLPKISQPTEFCTAESKPHLMLKDYFKQQLT